MPHRQILRNISGGKLSSLYVLHGEEPFFITEIVHALLDTVVDEDFKDFNETVLYGRDTDVDEVLAAARRFPMMADRQLVLVKEAQDMRMWKRKDDMAKLAAYAEDPVPTTVLVFAHPHKKVDSRLKAVKTMSRQGTLFLSDKVRDHKLPQWIAGYAEGKGLKLDGRVSQLLAESLGNNLQKVANELSKLQILLPEGTNVTTDHVEQHIGISKDYNVFELQRALGNKDIERALGTRDYPRLRIGIDPPGRIPQVDYVLGKFTADQLDALDPALTRACDATEAWLGDGIEAAMNRFNTKADD